MKEWARELVELSKKIKITGWGALLPPKKLLPNIDYSIVRSLMDKARGFLWVTPKERIHIDSFPLIITDDKIVFSTNRLNYEVKITKNEVDIGGYKAPITEKEFEILRIFALINVKLAILNTEYEEKELLKYIH